MRSKEKNRALRQRTTEAEKVLWEYLRAHRFGGLHFRRQHAIAQKYIADFYCAKLKLVIELDGEIHQKPDTREYDAHRTKDLESLGIQVIRFTNEDILNDREKIFHVLNHLTPSPSPPSGEGRIGKADRGGA